LPTEISNRVKITTRVGVGKILAHSRFVNFFSRGPQAIFGGWEPLPLITLRGWQPPSSRAQAEQDVLHHRRYERVKRNALELTVRGDCDQAL
jgi:hypothetical protein